MKILLFLHFIYSLCLFFDLIKALAADFLCPQTTFFGTKLDSLKQKKKRPKITTEKLLNWRINVESNNKYYTLLVSIQCNVSNDYAA